MTSSLTAQHLRALLDYDAETGVFTWRVARRRIVKGSAAGSVNGDGYVTIGIDYSRYQAHRLAWLYMTGEWPVNEIDHKNRVRDDNKWSNLREATSSQNHRNSRAHTSGLKGTHLDKQSKRWRAFIRQDGKQRYLGTFATAADAHAAYCTAAMEIDPEFARFA
jgi:hypothetical protein